MATAARATRTRCACATRASTCGSASGRLEVPRQGRGGGPDRRYPRRGRRLGRPDHGARAGHRAGVIYTDDIAPNLKDGDALFFGHGFNIRYDLIKPPAASTWHGRPEGPRPPGAPPVRRRQGCSRLIAIDQDPKGGARPSRCPTPRASAAPAPASSRPRSRKRPRRTSSASRPCSAAAPRNWSRPVSRSSSRPATRPRWRTSRCCTSSSSSSTSCTRVASPNELLGLRHRGVRRPLPGPRVITAATKER